MKEMSSSLLQLTSKTKHTKSALAALFLPTIFSFSILSVSLEAKVNLLNASYNGTFVDLALFTGFSIERSYSSRRNRTGFFGYGWCSSLEERVEVQNKEIWLMKCDEIKDRFYLKKIKNSERIYISSLTKEKVLFKRGKYYRKNALSYREYGPEGRLRWVGGGAGQDGVQILYKKKVPFKVSFKNKIFKIQNSGRFITMISHQNKPLIKYQYLRKFLIKIENKNTYHLKYSDTGNLLSFSKNGKIQLEIEFDEEKDLVKRISPLGNCSTQYNFQSFGLKRQVQILSCKSREIVKIELYENGVPKKIESRQRGRVVLTNYQRNGKVFEKYVNSIKFIYTYKDSGYSIKEHGKDGLRTYVFGAENRLFEIRDEKNKAMLFEYDNQGRVISIQLEAGLIQYLYKLNQQEPHSVYFNSNLVTRRLKKKIKVYDPGLTKKVSDVLKAISHIDEMRIQ